jgi:signal transduction histidine kinase
MRFRITAIAVVVSGIVLTLTAVGVVLVMRSRLWDNVDASLAQRADQIEAAAIANPDGPLPNSGDEERFAQVLDSNGEVLQATDNVDGLGALVDPPSGDRALSTLSGLPIDEDEFRVLARRFEGDRFVVVGESADDISEAVRSLILALGFTIPIAIAALGGMVWWLVGRTLRPVDRMRREVDAIGPGELDSRVAAPGTGDEIDELARTMNAMLARLDESAARQRRFVSDASHELRTPLARIRSTLEVELTQPADQRSVPALELTCRSALDDVVRMQDLVDDLLRIAQHDARQVADVAELVDLDVIVDEEVRAVRRLTPIQIDMTGVSGATVRGVPSELARVVRNLLTNAVRHARQRVVVRLDERDEVVLTVDDDGPGIPPAERERVFERFVRLDAARAAVDGGSGLGLSIARDVVSGHGGRISIGEAPIAGARITVVLPTVDQR